MDKNSPISLGINESQDYAVQLSTPINAKNKKYPLNAFNETAST